MLKRPSWQVDAKWLAAIAFILCAAIACGAYTVYRLTAYEPAAGATAPVIETMTKQALSDEVFAQIQEAARMNPDAEVAASGINIPLRGEEVTGMSKDQVLLESSRRLADILYNQGPSAGEVYFQDLNPESEPDPADPDAGDEGLQLDMLALFTRDVHDGVRPFFIGAAVLAALLLGLAAFFSRGPGRLGTPGVVLVIAVGPFALATRLLSRLLVDGQDKDRRIADATRALYGPVSDLSNVFALFALIGAALIIAAAGGQIAAILVRRRRSRPAATPPAVTASESPAHA